MRKSIALVGVARRSAADNDAEAAGSAIAVSVVGRSAPCRVICDHPLGTAKQSPIRARVSLPSRSGGATVRHAQRDGARPPGTYP